MFSYLHCVVRIWETSVPALDDPLMISSFVDNCDVVSRVFV